MAFQAKARKDAVQAEQLLEVLVEDRPDDLREAWESLPASPVAKAVRRRLQSLPEPLRERVTKVVGG
jgi:hypothetical protein